jgi:hypothetical protein
MYQKKGAFVAAAFLLGTALGPSAPGIPSPENISADQVERGNERPAPTASKDTIGPSVEEAREMIVGTWIEDVSDEIGVYKKARKNGYSPRTGPSRGTAAPTPGPTSWRRPSSMLSSTKTPAPVRKHRRPDFSQPTSKLPSPTVTSITML